ncbi:MAG: Ig-like domain-containing protein [Armatimonas sp.]
MKPLIALGALSLLGAVSLTVGCGGGAATSVVSDATGRATVSIVWPETTRLIPAGASSIKVQFFQNGTAVATQTAARPESGGASTLSFSSLTPGTLSVVATAYPNADGTGTAQASAATDVTIVAGQDTPVGLTMASTISSLAISPTSPSVVVGATGNLGVTASDSNGSSVLVATSAISWSSSDTSIATVATGGVVTGVAAGTTTITATDNESGKTATTTLRVVTPDEVWVTLSPTSASLSVLAQQAFTATVNNATVQNVTWSVTEGAAGGTITSAGVYTAPNTPGTYHIVATSVAYPTKSATATVLVQGGSANVIVK